MSEAVPVRRVVPPVTVVVAGVLMVGIAALYLVDVALGLYEVVAFMELHEELQGEARVHDPHPLEAFAVFGGLGAYALLAAAFGLLGYSILRGSRGSRTALWVLAPFVVCFSTGGVLAQLAVGPYMDVSKAPEHYERMQEMLPDWLFGAVILAQVLIAVNLILAIVLLALPVSNAYFRTEGQTPAALPQPTGA